MLPIYIILLVLVHNTNNFEYKVYDKVVTMKIYHMNKFHIRNDLICLFKFVVNTQVNHCNHNTETRNEVTVIDGQPDVTFNEALNWYTGLFNLKLTPTPLN